MLPILTHWAFDCFYQTVRNSLGKPVCANGPQKSVNIKWHIPLNPNLTRAGWDPHLLTSWPGDSAAGPPHCHSCGVVSCVNRTLEAMMWSVRKSERGWQERERRGWLARGKKEYEKKKKTSRGTKNSNSHSGSYIIIHAAPPLQTH